jgi:hypothetical protein
VTPRGNIPVLKKAVNTAWGWFAQKLNMRSLSCLTEAEYTVSGWLFADVKVINLLDLGDAANGRKIIVTTT